MTPGPALSIVREGELWKLTLATHHGDIVLVGARAGTLAKAMRILRAGIREVAA